MDIFMLFVAALALILVAVSIGIADAARNYSEKALRIANEAQDDTRRLNTALVSTRDKQARTTDAAERDRQDIMLRLSTIEGRQAVDDFHHDLPDAKAS